MDKEDTGVYRDAKLDLDLAFVTVLGRENRGVFIPHANLATLQTEISKVLASARAMLPKMGSALVLNKVTSAINASPSDLTNLLGWAGAVFVEEGRTLTPLGAGGLSPGIVLGLVQLGASPAPFLLRKEGGGSRLPDAAGNLYIDKAHFPNKDAVLTSLGIAPDEFGKFVNVTPVMVDSFADANRRADADVAKGANKFVGQGFAYASTVEVRLRPDRRYLAKGKKFDEAFTGVADPSPTLASLTSSYESLPGPAAPEWVADLAGGRDGDQNATMNDWGALGVAAFHNKFRAAKGGVVPVDTNWEWLHIRGAQVGGETEQNNLLAGTFAANSEMIPFEAQIQKWHQGNHGKIFGRFSAIARDGVLAERIRIEIATRDHPTLGNIAKESPLTVEFFPLAGKVVDKLSGKIQQEAFRKQEEGRRRELSQKLEVFSQVPPSLDPLLPQFPPPAEPQPSTSSSLVQSQPQLLVPSLGPGNLPGSIVATITPTSQSIEAQFGTLFGSVLDEPDPMASLAPVFVNLGELGFSIDIPDFGLQIGPAQLRNPTPLFRTLGRFRRRPQLIARDPSSFVDSGEALIPSGTKRRFEDPLAFLRSLQIKIRRVAVPEEASPLLPSIDLGGLPPLLLPLLMPPPGSEDVAMDEGEEEEEEQIT